MNMAHKKSFVVREAGLRDVDDLVDLHFNCFDRKEHLALCLGKPFMRDAYKRFIMSDKAFSLVCESRQTLIGFLTVCIGQYHHLIFANNKISIIKAFLLRPWLVFHPEILRRGFNVVSQSDVPDKIRQNDKDIAHGGAIGIHHNYRRTGLAFTLIKEMIRKCYKRKWVRIRVVIYKDNVASRRMMKKLGFIETPLPGTVKIVSELNLEKTHHLSDIC